MAHNILRHFRFEHLPTHLQAVSEPFCRLAHVVAVGPENEQTRLALVKLLEAKDCAVRAVLENVAEVREVPAGLAAYAARDVDGAVRASLDAAAKLGPTGPAVGDS